MPTETEREKETIFIQTNTEIGSVLYLIDRIPYYTQPDRLGKYYSPSDEDRLKGEESSTQEREPIYKALLQKTLKVVTHGEPLTEGDNPFDYLHSATTLFLVMNTGVDEAWDIYDGAHYGYRPRQVYEPEVAFVRHVPHENYLFTQAFHRRWASYDTVDAVREFMIHEEGKLPTQLRDLPIKYKDSIESARVLPININYLVTSLQILAYISTLAEDPANPMLQVLPITALEIMAIFILNTKMAHHDEFESLLDYISLRFNTPIYPSDDPLELRSYPSPDYNVMNCLPTGYTAEPFLIKRYNSLDPTLREYYSRKRDGKSDKPQLERVAEIVAAMNPDTPFIDVSKKLERLKNRTRRGIPYDTTGMMAAQEFINNKRVQRSGRASIENQKRQIAQEGLAYHELVQMVETRILSTPHFSYFLPPTEFIANIDRSIQDSNILGLADFISEDAYFKRSFPTARNAKEAIRLIFVEQPLFHGDRFAILSSFINNKMSTAEILLFKVAIISCIPDNVMSQREKILYLFHTPIDSSHLRTFIYDLVSRGSDKENRDKDRNKNASITDFYQKPHETRNIVRNLTKRFPYSNISLYESLRRDYIEGRVEGSFLEETSEFMRSYRLMGSYRMDDYDIPNTLTPVTHVIASTPKGRIRMREGINIPLAFQPTNSLLGEIQGDVVSEIRVTRISGGITQEQLNQLMLEVKGDLVIPLSPGFRIPIGTEIMAVYSHQEGITAKVMTHNILSTNSVVSEGYVVIRFLEKKAQERVITSLSNPTFNLETSKRWAAKHLPEVKRGLDVLFMLFSEEILQKQAIPYSSEGWEGTIQSQIQRYTRFMIAHYSYDIITVRLNEFIFQNIDPSRSLHCEPAAFSMAVFFKALGYDTLKMSILPTKITSKQSNELLFWMSHAQTIITIPGTNQGIIADSTPTRFANLRIKNAMMSRPAFLASREQSLFDAKELLYLLNSKLLQIARIPSGLLAIAKKTIGAFKRDRKRNNGPQEEIANDGDKTFKDVQGVMPLDPIKRISPEAVIEEMPSRINPLNASEAFGIILKRFNPLLPFQLNIADSLAILSRYKDLPFGLTWENVLDHITNEKPHLFTLINSLAFEDTASLTDEELILLDNVRNELKERNSSEVYHKFQAMIESRPGLLNHLTGTQYRDEVILLNSLVQHLEYISTNILVLYAALHYENLPILTSEMNANNPLYLIRDSSLTTELAYLIASLDDGTMEGSWQSLILALRISRLHDY